MVVLQSARAPEWPKEAPSSRYVVGIDLGTTNSAVAYASLEPEADAAHAPIRLFPVPQLCGPGQLAARPILPSFLYLPGPYELPAESLALPWDPGRGYLVGEFARDQGASVPGRLVSSAKSWLCHAGVSRSAPILPWGARDDEVVKVSPVAASARILQHVREAWNHQMAAEHDELRLEGQLVLLTVPASFDEVARELTVQAARDAGLARVILLEEPLAAFYSWLCRHEDAWQGRMRPGELVLICDVGGGTTDFSIVGIRQGEQGLLLDRLAVGDHLMLGGDNMDMAIARKVEIGWFGGPGKLDSRRFHQLGHQCRRAKEQLLSADGSAGRFDVAVLGAGRKLIAETLRATLERDEVERDILEGFFPRVGLEEIPTLGAQRAALSEWGLPYVRDPAVTRHLASFWQRFSALLTRETGRERPLPDHVLFNGGALIPQGIRARLLEVLGGWFGERAGAGWRPNELSNPSPELAVAEGAAYYGLVRAGRGVRVGTGSPRSYYVKVADGDPQAEASQRGVCLVARGTEEGFEAELEEPAFEVLANQPAAFQLLCSSTRLGDRVGELVTVGDGEVSLLPPIRTVLRHGKKGQAVRLPVRLSVRLTEVGTLELWCQARQSAHRWQLQFDVRQGAESPESFSAPAETLPQEVVEAGLAEIRAVFQPAPGGRGAPPEPLVARIAELFERRKESWPAPLLRKLADALLSCADGRQLSAAHEGRWLNLFGFCLRPGFGDPLDEWRMKEAWKLCLRGLVFPRQDQGRLEWWIAWRRLAGGLSAGQQKALHQQLASSLSATARKKKASATAPRRLGLQEETEIWMLLGSLERLPVPAKIELGRKLLDRLRDGQPRPQELWTLSRLGARVLLFGPLDLVVPGEEVEGWIERLLALPLSPTEEGARALVQLGRRTGSREREVGEGLRERIAGWLSGHPDPVHLLSLLDDPGVALSQKEREWVFGDALPSGLSIVPSGGTEPG